MEKVSGKVGRCRSLLDFASAHAMLAYARRHVEQHRQAEFIAAFTKYERASLTEVTEEAFTLEYTWAVHVSGWSARVITAKIDKILAVHNIVVDGKFIPATPQSVLNVDDYDKVLTVFKNVAKARAVIETRLLISLETWPEFKKDYLLKPVLPERLQKLSYMGPAMSCHLARNLGNLDVVKPDKHLVRLADYYGFETPLVMCQTIAQGEPVGKIDLILWLAAIDAGTL